MPTAFFQQHFAKRILHSILPAALNQKYFTSRILLLPIAHSQHSVIIVSIICKQQFTRSILQAPFHH